MSLSRDMSSLSQCNRGFTLIELLVVIAIISILSSVVLASLNGARARARDAKRMTELHQIQLALEHYHLEHQTYRVAGAGWSGGGQGWVGYEDGVNYTKAVTRELYDRGYLPEPIMDDPLSKPSYMIYLCENFQVYAVSATKEYPTAEDIAFIQRTCNGIGGNGTHTRYGKNFAVTNKPY